MSDSPRYNSPSRKSRFRTQGRSRPDAYTPDAGTTEEEPAEEIAAADEVLHDADLQTPEDASSFDPAATTDDVPTLQEDALPAGLRLTRNPDQLPVRQGIFAGTATALVLTALAAGGAAGYYFGNTQGRADARSAPVIENAKNKTPLDLSSDLRAAIDAAFDDTKHARYDEARKHFEEIYAKHPEWSSMEIEAARAALYARDFQGTEVLLSRATRDRPLADAALLTALLHLTAQEYDNADVSFAAAAATDPARADVYYFWGENLRREGKPLLAAEKFKAALGRNQYENVEPLYLLKYWISLIQADQEGSSGEGAKIDDILASAHPTSAALFAGAARAIKAADYKAAAGFITKAQAITDPTVFGVVLRDPTFTEANMQPALAGFYK